MIKVLEKAIEKVKALSPEQQRHAAEILEQIAEDSGQVHRLSNRERLLVHDGLDELDRGEAATEAEVQAVYDKYRT